MTICIGVTIILAFYIGKNMYKGDGACSNFDAFFYVDHKITYIQSPKRVMQKSFPFMELQSFIEQNARKK